LAAVSDSALDCDEYIMVNSDVGRISTNPRTAVLVFSVFPDRDTGFFLVLRLFKSIITGLKHERSFFYFIESKDGRKILGRV
jgi:hypothetical protein